MTHWSTHAKQKKIVFQNLISSISNFSPDDDEDDDDIHSTVVTGKLLLDNYDDMDHDSGGAGGGGGGGSGSHDKKARLEALLEAAGKIELILAYNRWVCGMQLLVENGGCRET